MAMLDPKLAQLPYTIQSVYLHNCLKILAYLLTKSKPKSSPSAPKTADLIDGDADDLQNGEVTTDEPINQTPSLPNQDHIDLHSLQDKLKVFLSSEELEVQERAGTLHNFIKCYIKLESKGQQEDLLEVASDLSAAFSSELNPVAAKAQKKVPVPEGLDLDAWINDPPSETSEEEEEEEETKSTDVFVKSGGDYGGGISEKRPVYQPSEEELTQVCEI